MIDIDDVVTRLKCIFNSPVILHRSLKVHPKFKVYKIFEYRLYTLSDNNETKLIISKDFILNSSELDMVSMWNEHDKEFLSIIFEYIKNEFIIQQVSN
jgi:hypothetical protein